MPHFEVKTTETHHLTYIIAGDNEEHARSRLSNAEFAGRPMVNDAIIESIDSVTELKSDEAPVSGAPDPID